MKSPLLILLIILSFHLPEQVKSQKLTDDGVLILHDSLVKGRFGELDLASLKGWRFNPKDDEIFSSSTYDDSQWEIIDGPLNERKNVPNSWNGFGWFRLKVKVDSSFSATQSLISINNSGGLEFYINDSLIKKQGNPSTLASKEVLFGSTVDPGRFFPWEKGKTYQLAVKYSFHDFSSLQGLLDTSSPLQFTLAVFNLRNLKKLVLQSQRFAIVFASSSLLLFLVMILHFTLYKRTKDEVGNFWVFLLSFTIFISTFFTVLRNNYDFSGFFIATFMSLIISIGIFSSIGLIPIVAHKVLQVGYNSFWKYFTVYPVLALTMSFLASDLYIGKDYGLYINTLALFLAIGGGVIAVRKAKKQNRKDLYIIAIPILAFPVIFVFGILFFQALKIESLSLELFMIFLVVNIIPLGFSVYQARRFFRMHRHLDQLVFQRTRDLEKAYVDLETSLNTLKAAQNQLIQQEKLASMGQLTAGIAHEIKNPLNFVTNFSDVCLELIEEAKTEIRVARKSRVSEGNKNENSQPELLKDILATLEENLKKIYQHGNRADRIVKSMLLHSRGGSGKPEPLDLNKLVHEYVNLAFHGMRAAKNPIDVDIQFDLDETVGDVSLLKEDFSRVILNLCNNAFDALRQKLKKTSFSPELQVQTLRKVNKVVLEISDNGTGIPEEIKEKILQPFFTTKKGTEGTGLGLSITNDIVMAHGGEIRIESVPGAGATFIIILPYIEE